VLEFLNFEYRVYLKELCREWLAQNHSLPRDVREVKARWIRYMTPLADAWWRERGYSVVWPDGGGTEPVKVHKLEAA
jgi:hypothetical protein